MITNLYEALPVGYIKLTQATMPRPSSASSICNVATGKVKNKEIREALYWVAMENILGKMLELPNR